MSVLAVLWGEPQGIELLYTNSVMCSRHPMVCCRYVETETPPTNLHSPLDSPRCRGSDGQSKTYTLPVSLRATCDHQSPCPEPAVVRRKPQEDRDGDSP